MSDAQQPAPQPKFNMVDVESTNLGSVGYDPETQTLRIKFKDGAPYDYRGVPPQMHGELMGAESKGSFFFKRIKSARREDGSLMFPFTRVNQQQEETQEADAPA